MFKACKACKEPSSGICALLVGETPGHTEMPRSALGWGSRGWASIFQPGSPVLCHLCPSQSWRCAIDFLPAFAGMLTSQNSNLLPGRFPDWAEEKKPDHGTSVEGIWVQVCAHEDIIRGFPHHPFVFLTERCPWLLLALFLQMRAACPGFHLSVRALHAL